MRYLLSEGQYSEIEERKKYIFDVFQIYMLEKVEVDGFIVLESIPTKTPDIFMIVGHADEVFNYIKVNKDNIKENTVIAISCYANRVKNLNLTGKEVYISYQRQRYSYYRDGKDYGFGFKITDSELDLYNARKHDINRKIGMSFTKL